METRVRAATLNDAEKIAEIIQLAFEELSSIEQVRLCIQQATHTTYVAEVDNGVVGFVFGFITTALDGTKRRELDLQAVHPNYQGRGIGTKLIQHFTQDTTPADCIRALIAIGNTRMEKALTNFSYQAGEQISALYVTSQSYKLGKIIIPSHSHLIPVTTMTYNGIWIEGKVTKQAINAALNSKKRGNDVVGAVVPISDDAAIQALKSADFDFIKHYRRWMK